MTALITSGITKYPSKRNGTGTVCSETWLEGKREDDALGENVWRIHDKLYDLSGFIAKHPGGADWITMTNGMDISEAFEAHHPNIQKARALLKKYEVSETDARYAVILDTNGKLKPRLSPYTFEENGFYCTLRSRVFEQVLKEKGMGSTFKTRFFIDCLLSTYMFFMIMAVVFIGWSGGEKGSYLNTFFLPKGTFVCVCISSLFLALSAIASHNFFHQRDNWRMYIFDLCGLSSWDWRVSHAFSHHLYTNTILDFEISGFEPFFKFLPQNNKNFVQRYLSGIYSHFLYFLIIPIEVTKRAIRTANGKQKRRKENFFIFVELLILILAAGFEGVKIWLLLISATSYIFIFIGLIAAHHHPDIWHEGDPLADDIPSVKCRDWGACQVIAVGDRVEILGNVWFTLISFGDHCLHHLFPTIDHGRLPELYPIVMETMKEFRIPFRTERALDMAIGKYQQLKRISPHASAKKPANSYIQN